MTKVQLSGITVAKNYEKQNLLVIKHNSQYQHANDKSHVILLHMDLMDEIVNKISTARGHEADATSP